MDKRQILFIFYLFLGFFLVSGTDSPLGISIASASPVMGKEKPASEAWEQKWNKILVEARKEGKAVAYGNFSAGERGSVSKGLKAKYGIDMEWITGNSSQVVNKIISERTAGLYIADIFASGVAGAIDMLKPKGYLQKLDEAVILPEVKDSGLWFGKRFPWFDHDHTNIAFVASVTPNLIVNNDLVKEGEISGYRDILNPRWKGKIVMFNPTITGSALSWFTIMGPVLGGDAYMRELVKQEPAILNDNRLTVEWVARGKAGIGLGLRSDEIISFIKMGASIRMITPREGEYLSVSHGTVSFLKNAPHPNASIVFLNYLLGREGQTAYSQAGGATVRRLDTPTDHLLPGMMLVAGRHYLEQNEEFASIHVENSQLAKEIFGPLMK